MSGEPLDRLAELLGAARSVLVLTGAGVSADSGLPTYRGVAGLYAGGRTEEGLPIEEVVSGAMLVSDPGLCWKYLARIGRACAGAVPNAAHFALAALERRRELRLLTQNVDGLHRAAGSREVVELHGNLDELICTGCGAGEAAGEEHLRRLPPRCRRCGAVLRPRVVLFGEDLPPAVLAALDEVARETWDLALVVGTTAVFSYVQFPALRVLDAGGELVEINPERTVLSGATTLRLEIGAADCFRRLAERAPELFPGIG
ncbi:MAG: NAD-dependent protein deacylase [Planctomycetota bacterium]|nr:MAG: NAD-dependent protein deacylase [Planctomycetota bacterium]